MPDLYTRDGKRVRVPASQVAELIKSGRYGAMRDDRFDVVKPGGEVVSVAGSDLPGVLGAGWQMEDDAATRERHLQEEYGGGGEQAIAAGLGLARGLSFGASDLLISTLGGEGAADYVSKLQEANPASSVVGEVGAVALGLGAARLGAKAGAELGEIALREGAEAAVKRGAARAVARAAAQPVAKVAQLGAGVEARVAGAIAGKGSGVLRQAIARGAGMGAGQGVEGAIYGAGQFVSEYALGDVELTGENLTASVGMGALLGGAFGGGLGFSGKLVKEATKKTAGAIGRTAKSTVSLWERGTGTTAVKGLAEDMATVESGKIPLSVKASAKLSGVDVESLDDLMKIAKKDPDVITQLPQKAREHYAEQLTKYRQGMMDVEDDLIDRVIGKQKDRLVEKMTDNADPLPAYSRAMSEYGEIATELDDMIAAGRDEFHNIRAIKKYRKAIKKQTEAIDAMLGDPEDTRKLVGEVFNGVDAIKQEIGRARIKLLEMAGRARRSGQGFGLEAIEATAERLRPHYERLRVMLEDAALFGDEAATMQKKINAAWSVKLKDAARRSEFRFTKAWEGGDYWETGRLTRQARQQGHLDYVSALGSARTAEETGFIMQDLAATERLLTEITDTAQLDDATARLLDTWRESKRSYVRAHDDAARVVGVQNQLTDIAAQGERMSSSLPMGVGGVGGFLVGGPVGALAGMGLGLLTSPGKMVHLQATVSRLSRDLDLSVGKAVAAYTRKIGGRAADTARPGIGAARRGAVQSLRDDMIEKYRRAVAPGAVLLQSTRQDWEDKRKPPARKVRQAYERIRAQVDKLATDADALAEQIDRESGAVAAVAPSVAVAVQAAGARAVAHLAKTAPRPPSKRWLGEKEWAPSERQIARWERTVRAVLDPMTLLSDMQKGSVTVDAVQAVREVYPRLYETVVVTLAEQTAELRDRIPYRDRVQLSVLFGVPVERTMEPGFRALMSAADQSAQPQGQAQQARRRQPKRASETDLDIMQAPQGGFAYTGSEA